MPAEPALSLLATLFVLAACYAAGRLVSGRRVMAWPLHLVLGMAALSTVFFVLLACGAGHPVGFVVAGGAAIAIWAMRCRPLLGGATGRLPAWAGILLGVYFVFYLVHALVPETTYDAAGYHLGLPAEWLRLGAFPRRVGFYELLPQGMDSIYGFALAVHNNSVAPKLFHLACLASTCALLLDVGRKLELPEWAAPAAAVLYVTCPVTGVSAASAYTDVAFGLAVLAAFRLALEAWDKEDVPSWALAGLAAGFCYAVKVPGLVAVACIGLVLAWKHRWRAAAGFAAGASVVVLPWMSRSFLVTGNPLAPMLNGLFPNPWFSPAVDAYVRGVFQFDFVKDLRAAGIPWELAFHGEHLGLMGPMILLAPLGLLGLLRQKTRPLAIVAVVMLGVYSQNLGARFLLPAFLFMAMALAALVPKRAAQGLALLAALACWPVATARYAAPATTLEGWPWRAALGLESHQVYLRRQMAVYAFADLTRSKVRPDALIFDCVGLPSYYAAAVTKMHWQSSELMRLHRLILQSTGTEERTQVGVEFAKLGIRYLTLSTSAAATVPWAVDLFRQPEAWGFRLSGSEGDYRLYELAPGSQQEIP